MILEVSSYHMNRSRHSVGGSAVMMTNNNVQIIVYVGHRLVVEVHYPGLVHGSAKVIEGSIR